MACYAKLRQLDNKQCVNHRNEEAHTIYFRCNKSCLVNMKCSTIKRNKNIQILTRNVLKTREKQNSKTGGKTCKQNSYIIENYFKI